MDNIKTLKQALARIEELEKEHVHKYILKKEEIIGLYGITCAYIIYLYCETCGNVKERNIS